VVEDVTYRDITMKNVDAAIYINLFYDDKSAAKFPHPKPVTADTPRVRNILISNVTCQNAKAAGEITALPESDASNITLENVHISAWTGFSIQDAEGLDFKNVSITTSPKPAEALIDASASPAPSALNAPTISAAVSHVSVTPHNGTITVAADGSGDCQYLQDAIDAAPKAGTAGSAGARPFLIHIKPGTYKECVSIPAAKGPIQLAGDDAASTVITYSNAAATLDASGKPIGTFNSASAVINSNDFSASNITFQNSYGRGSQALAISVGGERDAFRKCRFLGWQDTVLLRDGRQYFENCDITGAVDFIFGAATALFSRCQIHCVGSGYITAASTPEDHPYGFVFANCAITADPGVKTYLGRPWRPYASVAFLQTSMPDAIRPEGWFNWSNPDNEKTARYAEWKNSGPGAATQARVPWARQLTDEQVRSITMDEVLGGWNPAGEAKAAGSAQ
jgi:pectinesterase